MFVSVNPAAKLGLTATAEFRIRFKSGSHYSLVRRKHVTETDIFAFVGGLLGLFLGVSVISLVEVANTLLRLLFLKLSCTKALRLFRCNVLSVSKKIDCACIEKSATAAYFKSYFRESSIHSFSYIASDSSWVAKFFWLLMFAFSMTGCVFMTKNLYEKLNFKAITLNIDDQAVEVAKVPFPAMTIFGPYPNPRWLLGRYPDIYKNLDLMLSLQDLKNYWKILVE